MLRLPVVAQLGKSPQALVARGRNTLTARSLVGFVVLNHEKERLNAFRALSLSFLVFPELTGESLRTLGVWGTWGFGSVSWFLSESSMNKVFYPSVCKVCSLLYQPVTWLRFRVDGY